MIIHGGGGVAGASSEGDSGSKKDQHKDNITPKDISQVNGGLIIGQIYFKTLI